MSSDKELEFENQAFVELLSEDGLIILARWAKEKEAAWSF